MSMEIRSIKCSDKPKAFTGVFANAFGKEFGERLLKRISRIKDSERCNHRIVTVDGRIVSYLEILPKRLYIGKALLNMGGLAAVCTDSSERKKGYGRALLEDTVKFMTKEGYDISVLYGIPNYYHKYGYEVIMARNYCVTMAAADLPERRFPYKQAAVVKKDFPELVKLYNRHARGRDGNCLRDTMRKPSRAFKLTDSKGRIAAYVCWQDEMGTMVITDAVASSVDAAQELLPAIRHIAARSAMDHIRVMLPFG